MCRKRKFNRLIQTAKAASLVLIFLSVSAGVSADHDTSTLRFGKTPKIQVRSETIRIVTAYNVGDPRQTDNTPCISANGENICKALAKGKKRCAANFVPLGTRLHVEKVGVCLVTDRTNKRYRNRVDIAMKKNEYPKARQFGRQKLKVKILADRPDR
jgi:3D (Asp-Asp-Asp) domain-containing protein